ncbi:hypothetical protein [[Mycobacterium] wendilense]|uniref:Baseplate protein J-like domain-containing protein n=1 Tax=[Mycobacterium] wendilense TaxID=3064284 RepID=A0ABN9NYV6_9MYCO|nr:hypothetical protein [Mycolicibacterium sp. MU0050]CAJ1582943.1 hypothetical protein MU0050_002357 [Mycolicibacterium sp. MU0050]
MLRYQLPSVADLIELGRPHRNAITVYVQTAPGPDHRENALLSAKSAVDRALRTVRESGAKHAVENQLRQRWEEIADSELWRSLSRSLAIFIADDQHQVYVLPNGLETQLQVGQYFDIGQLVRAVTTPQEAYALTLSADGWNLWHATAASRAEEMPLTEEYAADAAEATNRTTIRGRGQVGRLVGDEGKKTLLQTYAKRVADAVESELSQADPDRKLPLYLFATDPLLDFYRNVDGKHRLVAVPGAPDDLRPDQIDAAIRESLPTLNTARVNTRLGDIADTVSRGLVATDIGDIARAAVAGAVSTLLYDFTVDVLGILDDATGEVNYTPDGYDLLSRIAVTVLDKGGEVIAVRSQEVSAPIWNGTAVAELRFALS